MKQLQNDFTTPEQSKRLLELGVPADSANGAVYPDGHVDYLNGETFTQFAIRIYESVEECPYKPSWSVGRLMKILQITAEKDYSVCFIGQEPVRHVEDIVSAFEHYIGLFDFSKLED